MSNFKKRDRVKCACFGKGEVTEIRTGSSFSIFVLFDSGFFRSYMEDGRMYPSVLPTLELDIPEEDPFEGLPEWVNYIAEDENRELWGFASEPIIDDRHDVWDVNVDDNRCICLESLNKNWKSSLIKRHK